MILLTGASGFIGKHILTALINRYGNNNIVALTSKPIEGCRYLLHKDYEFDENYLNDEGFGNVEIIVHAGAFIPKISQDANDIAKCNRNIHSTFKLVSSNLKGLKKIVFLSTIDVYKANGILTELSMVDPVSIYGGSKLYCEQIIAKKAVENNVVYQILRVGHVYGPGEEGYKKIIPITFQNLINSQGLKVYGEGSALRSFIYVEDVVNLIIRAIELNETKGVINLVGKEKTSILELIKNIVEISGLSPEIEQVNTAHQDRDLVFDDSKLVEILGGATTSLRDGLSKEWEYFKRLNK